MQPIAWENDVFITDKHMGRGQMRRVRLVDVDDRGDQQILIAEGLKGETIRGAARNQHFGSTGAPPVGSVGTAYLIAGRAGQAMFGALEHPDHRPRNLSFGEKAIYDANGQILKMVSGKKTVLEVGTLTIIADKVVIKSSDINLGGEGGQPVAIKGSGTTDGAVITSNLSSTVKAV